MACNENEINENLRLNCEIVCCIINLCNCITIKAIKDAKIDVVLDNVN